MIHTIVSEGNAGRGSFCNFGEFRQVSHGKGYEYDAKKIAESAANMLRTNGHRVKTVSRIDDEELLKPELSTKRVLFPIGEIWSY